MNYIHELGNKEFSEIRIIEQDGEPWFVGKDVCNYFNDSNHNRTLKRVDEVDKKNVELIDSMGRKQCAIAVNESGLYSILFTMQPQKAHKDGESDEYPIEVQNRIEKVRRFKHWVTSEVLPAIRKTGGYHLPQTYAEALRALADKAEEAERLENQNILLIEDNERMKPKEEFFDAVTDSKDAIDMKDTANALHMGIGRNKLFQFLRDQKILTQNNRPYQQYIDCGYFRVIEQKYDKGYGETGVNIKTVVFQRGVDFIRKRLKEHGFGESEGNE